jgi:DNA-binding transcriptional MerR regulator
MNEQPLKTMKEVADHLNQPAHRIIHLCETGVVHPTVDAAGRGSVRRFSRDDTFRILLALQLQDAGVQVPLIKPLMDHLDRLLEIREIKEFRHRLDPFDLVEVIRRKLGTRAEPARAVLTPPDRIALVAPKFIVPTRPDVRVDLHSSDHDLLRRGVCIVVSLTEIAEYLANTLWEGAFLKNDKRS